MSPVEVQAALGVSRRTLWRYRKDGRLTPSHHTPTGHARFRRADVEALRGRGPGAVAEAGHAVPRLLAAVALAFILAAGLPAHAGVTLLVAAFVGHLFGRLFWAEVSTWGTPAGDRHLEQPGRRDRTADR